MRYKGKADMRFKTLMRYLNRWKSAELISEEQVKSIADHMKVESRNQFAKLLKALFIVGAFWVVFGLVATLSSINVEILKAIGRLFYILALPLITVAKRLSADHYRELLSGFGCLAGWALCHWLGIRLRNKTKLTATKLGFLRERQFSLGTSAFTAGYILAAAAWQFFNYVTYPSSPNSYMGEEVIIPFFSFAGTIFFVTIAYLLRDQIALLFGIGFLAHSVGLWTAYFFACYVLGVEMPVLQLAVGAVLLLVGFSHIRVSDGRDDPFWFSFGRTYQWTGLILIYLSLWIMSIWGITHKEHFWADPPAVELWIANLLFIAAALLALFYGAMKEDATFFNFGLTFLIIETYTLFFSRIWDTVGAAFASLLLGVLLIATGYIMRDLWLKGRILKRGS